MFLAFFAFFNLTVPFRSFVSLVFFVFYFLEIAVFLFCFVFTYFCVSFLFVFFRESVFVL